jgi:hypothetical protein
MSSLGPTLRVSANVMALAKVKVDARPSEALVSF